MVGAIINSALATLVTLSIMSLSLAAYHTLLIRDAAVSAASQAARFDAPEQNRYLLKMLQNSLPDLASYEVSGLGVGEFVGVSVRSQLPGFGLLLPPAVTVAAMAPKERVS